MTFYEKGSNNSKQLAQIAELSGQKSNNSISQTDNNRVDQKSQGDVKDIEFQLAQDSMEVKLQAERNELEKRRKEIELSLLSQ